MKKRLLFLMTLFAISFIDYAQPGDPRISEKIQFNGYFIQVFQITGHGYGFDILYQNALVQHQERNPFTNAPGGLKKKEDAVKAAKWQVIHIPPANPQLQLKKQLIPMEVAAQLNITTN